MMIADEPSGCIINVASLLGLKGGKGSTAYAASKAGVIGELNFDISYSPGLVDLDFHTHYFSQA